MHHQINSTSKTNREAEVVVEAKAGVEVEKKRNKFLIEFLQGAKFLIFKKVLVNVYSHKNGDEPKFQK
jgi:hypothetical protein